MRKNYLLILISIFFCLSCHDEEKTIEFNSFLTEPCMLVNSEQDNTTEGTYLIVEKYSFFDSTLTVNFNDDFFINNTNCSNWLIGWGNNLPNEDAGSENLMTIKKIDLKNKTILLGKLIKGKGFPALHQRVVFWNTNPSKFTHYSSTSIINTKLWPEFSGESIHFGSIVFDSISTKWYMFFNECDTSKIQIYAAMSSNLVVWEPANNGQPILQTNDFENCNWAGSNADGSIKQSPFVSDIIYHKKQWYLFMDGYNKSGKRQIGMAISKSSILSGYQILKSPIIEVKDNPTLNADAVYYAKVSKYQGGYIMFYDCKDKSNEEHVFMALSKDLKQWNSYLKNPIITNHNGWRSKKDCSEPNYIEVKQDTIFLLVTGAKKSKANFWHHYISKRMYMDISGNVDDAELGYYMSLDGGKNFIANKNNPVFTNDYSNDLEGDHLGGNIKLIKTDSVDYLFYQAKSFNKGLKKYSVLLRTREKH
jgi:hypothetical protein